MKIVLLVLYIVFNSVCVLANPTPERTLPVDPVYRQTYEDSDQQPNEDGAGSRILNGKEAAPGQFPYQVALRIEIQAFCGGSLISKNWVLTAAHCVHNFGSWMVVLGAANLKDKQGRITLLSSTGMSHEKFNPTTLLNDIGVIQLPNDMTLNNRINIIKLPPKSYQNMNFTGVTARVSGWGKTSDSVSRQTQKLMFVDLLVINNDECLRAHGALANGPKYCCSGAGSKSTCHGDSGGSLTIVKGKDVTHLGIVSYGVKTGCSKGLPSGYTATPFYLDWISQKTGINVQ